VLLLNSDYSTLAVLSSERSNTGEWVTSAFDLTPYAGQSLILSFDVHNDGSARRTWQYMDEVSLTICGPDRSQQAVP
jgi:bacillopeptidase F (M6 metalloprotease family)